MTQQNVDLELDTDEEESQPPAPPPTYRIDEGWYERNRRSLEDMIAARVAEMSPADEPTTKRKRKSAAPSMADLSKIEGFVNPSLPVREAAFRLLLVHENKPLDAEQLSQELAERGIGILDARLIQAKTLERILDNDNYYGITRLEA